MSETEKQKEIMDFLEDNVFKPALEIGKETNNKSIIGGINLTKARMSKLPSKSMIAYYWSAIVGTDNSIRFSDILKDSDVVRFEDVLEEFRLRFDDNWLNQ